MIPQTAEYKCTQLAEQPTRTYFVDFDKGRCGGYIDGIAAMKQAIFLILSTPRFRHMIFSWNYGHELSDIFGEDTALAKCEAKRLITEALMQDERIRSADGFEFAAPEKGVLSVSFTVNTVFGELEQSVEVRT